MSDKISSGDTPYIVYPAMVLATWFGVGLIPKAPGTMGSLAALPIAWLIQQSWGNQGLLLAAFIMFFIGWWAAAIYVRVTQGDDPKEIVVDEVVGQWMLLAVLPAGQWAYVLGFVLFRLFDVLKPWPISLADSRIKGGLGVMLDDVLAALYPLIIATIMLLLIMQFGYSVPLETLFDWLESDIF